MPIGRGVEADAAVSAAAAAVRHGVHRDGAAHGHVGPAAGTGEDVRQAVGVDGGSDLSFGGAKFKSNIDLVCQIAEQKGEDYVV